MSAKGDLLLEERDRIFDAVSALSTPYYSGDKSLDFLSEVQVSRADVNNLLRDELDSQENIINRIKTFVKTNAELIIERKARKAKGEKFQVPVLLVITFS